MKIFNVAGLCLAILVLASCKMQQLMPQYLENVSNDNVDKNIVIPELKIQKNDLLAIQVYSDYVSPTSNPDALYNQPLPNGGAQTSASTGANLATTTNMNGYLVDKDGNITYPRLGVIHAEGLTKLQLEQEIKKRLTSPKELLVNPTVIIRFQSYKITTVGEFGAPQVLNIPTEKLTIFEAVAMSGGITEWGRKDQVKVIREQDGKREVGIVNLSSPDVFSSPYYYLKQNDMLVIDPIKQKAKLKDEATSLSRVSFATTIFSSVVAVTSFILLLTRKN